MDDELPEQKIDFSRFKDIFKSMENQLILQTSILKSIYGLNNESSRDNTRRTQYNKIAEVEAASGGPDANGYTYNSFRQPQAQSDYAKNTEETSSANSPINLLGAAALGGAGFSGAMGLIKATFTKIIKGQGFMGTMAKIFKSAIVLAFAGAVGDFVGGASEQTATNFGADPETSKAIGGIAENATEWGTWGYVLGSFVKKRVLFSLIGAVSGGVRNAFDPDKNGKIDDGALKGFNIDALTGISGGLTLIIGSFLSKWLWGGMKKVMSKVHMPAILTKLTGMFREIAASATTEVADAAVIGRASTGGPARVPTRIEPIGPAPIAQKFPVVLPIEGTPPALGGAVREGETIRAPSAFRAFGDKSLTLGTDLGLKAVSLLSKAAGVLGAVTPFLDPEFFGDTVGDGTLEGGRNYAVREMAKQFSSTGDIKPIIEQLQGPGIDGKPNGYAKMYGMEAYIQDPKDPHELVKLLREISLANGFTTPDQSMYLADSNMILGKAITKFVDKLNESGDLGFKLQELRDYNLSRINETTPLQSSSSVNVSPVTVGGATTSSVTNNNTTIITNPYASLNSPFLPQ